MHRFDLFRRHCKLFHSQFFALLVILFPLLSAPSIPAQEPAALVAAAQASSPVQSLPSSANWEPLSSTASGITGAIQTSPGKLLMSGHTIRLATSHSLTGQQLRDAGALFPVDVKPGTLAAVFRVNIPATLKFKGGNTLCGARDTKWLVLVQTDTDLNVAAFSSAAEPDLRPKVVANSTALCGTLSYTRK